MAAATPSSLHSFTPRNAADDAPVSAGSQGPACGCVDSAEILRGQKTVAISHHGSTYRLQATRLGKLILTK